MLPYEILIAENCALSGTVSGSLASGIDRVACRHMNGAQLYGYFGRLILIHLLWEPRALLSAETLNKS